MENNIIQSIKKEKIIVIVRGVSSDKLIPLAEAMYDGGIRLLEITYNADKKVTDEQTATNIGTLKNHFGEKMHIGAGTVLNEEQVVLTKKFGGEFIISPDACESVIKKTKALGMISMPGAFTPSEIAMAHNSGADFVKVFPVSALGTDYIKAVKAPLSHINLLAVGGVNDGNMEEYFNAGVCGFGIGSNIIDKKLLADNNYKGITELAKKYVSVIQRLAQ